MRSAFLLLFAVSAAAQTVAPHEQALLDRIAALEAPAPALEASAWLDVYYARNFNQPVSMQNQLRAFDQSSAGFGLNQTGIIVERPVDPANGRRFGARLDLMFGQAAETLMGNTGSERRPSVFRNIWQAYGTYAAPLGNGLTIDAGKWASSLGVEGNYTKDQINYSRGYWFIYLPFYHAGLRAAYPLGRGWSAQYWLVNGANQTEEFNTEPSQAAVLAYVPSSKLAWTLNYYAGREAAQRQGVTPSGRMHVIDTYVSVQPSARWTLALEADSVIARDPRGSPARRVSGGAAWARYRLTPRFSLGSRFALLRDRDALFSGARQTLKDTTVTAAFDLAEGFQMKWEYRRDFSNRAYFETASPGVWKRDQHTVLAGLLWWFGQKQGTW